MNKNYRQITIVSKANKQGDCLQSQTIVLMQLLKHHGASFLLKDLKRAWMTKAVGLLHPVSL